MSDDERAGPGWTGAVELVAEPAPAPGVRTFRASRRCRIGDCDATGRLRLDAVARYLQDVAYDDYAAAGFADEPDATWVARRVTVDVLAAPRFEEVVEVTTFASAIASRWAERRVSIVGAGGGHVEAAVLWVFVRPSTGAAAPLPDAFHAVYEGAAGGRTVRARFRHDAVPPTAPAAEGWALRATDADVLGHVNNAAYWPVLEQVLAAAAGDVDDLGPLRAEIEHRRPLEPTAAVRVVHRGSPTALLEVWVLDGDDVAATFRVGPVPPGAQRSE